MALVNKWQQLTSTVSFASGKSGYIDYGSSNSQSAFISDSPIVRVRNFDANEGTVLYIMLTLINGTSSDWQNGSYAIVSHSSSDMSNRYHSTDDGSWQQLNSSQNVNFFITINYVTGCELYVACNSSLAANLKISNCYVSVGNNQYDDGTTPANPKNSPVCTCNPYWTTASASSTSSNFLSIQYPQTMMHSFLATISNGSTSSIEITNNTTKPSVATPGPGTETIYQASGQGNASQTVYEWPLTTGNDSNFYRAATLTNINTGTPIKMLWPTKSGAITYSSRPLFKSSPHKWENRMWIRKDCRQGKATSVSSTDNTMGSYMPMTSKVKIVDSVNNTTLQYSSNSDTIHTDYHNTPSKTSTGSHTFTCTGQYTWTDIDNNSTKTVSIPAVSNTFSWTYTAKNDTGCSNLASKSSTSGVRAKLVELVEILDNRLAWYGLSASGITIPTKVAIKDYYKYLSQIHAKMNEIESLTGYSSGISAYNSSTVSSIKADAISKLYSKLTFQ